MNLCVDIGNTRVKTGLFRGKELLEQNIWTAWTLPELIDYGNQAGVKNVLFSTVAEPDPEMHEQLSAYFQAFELGTKTKLPFKNDYTTPETLGKDRLAAVAGAQALFPGENCLVVDFGTCIKYDILTAAGVYLGGNIAPGAMMRIKAMHHFTARLPEVPMEMPEHFTGNSTTSALQNGALRGMALEVEGFVRLFEQEHKALRILLTGGDANFFEPFLTISNNTNIPDLTLHGLNNILMYNT